MKKALFGLALLATVFVTTISCDDDDDKVIPSVDLPAKSHTFLNTYFEGVNVSRVESEENGYAVYLDNRIEIEFDSDGEWKEVDGENGVTISTDFILPKIVAYITNKYPQNNVNGIEKTLSGFDVDLVRQDIDLVFDLDGNFVRVDP